MSFKNSCLNFLLNCSFRQRSKKKTKGQQCGKCFHLTHWGWVKHICINKLTIIGSGNGLSPGWCEVIIWTNAGILLIRTLGTNFDKILSEIQTFSFNKMHLKMATLKCLQGLPCLGVNVLMMSSWNTKRLSIYCYRSQGQLQSPTCCQPSVPGKYVRVMLCL